MADICYGIVSDGECEDGNPGAARRRRMEIRKFKFLGVNSAESDDVEEIKYLHPSNQLSSSHSSPFPVGEYECVVDSQVVSPDMKGKKVVVKYLETDKVNSLNCCESTEETWISSICCEGLETSSNHRVTASVPRFGFASVCGRRRDMEDAVSVHPSFLQPPDEDKERAAGNNNRQHYFAVYDGHGCSHVAMRCRDRLHELVREEVANEGLDAWEIALRKSFSRMDKDVVNKSAAAAAAGRCKCELQAPECDVVGSTAVVAIVTPEKIVVANCGDSRAVLCRKGKPVPLSSDHKPDRPDELNRIQEAGGRVIYWEGARVLGVLAMSRAIGDNYLKPYVISDPEVTITDRIVDEDDCIILASDGLWDVVSNETACNIAAMCLKGKVRTTGTEDSLDSTTTTTTTVGLNDDETRMDKRCSDASMLLTKLALARHSTDNVSVVVIDLRRRRRRCNT